MVQRETLLIFILLSSLQCGKGMQINNAKLFSLHPDHPLIWQKGFVRLLGCRVQVSTKEELPSRSVRMREGYQTNNSAMMKWSMFGASWPAFLLWTMAVLNIEVIQQGLNKIQKHYFSGSVPPPLTLWDHSAPTYIPHLLFTGFSNSMTKPGFMIQKIHCYVQNICGCSPE